MKNQTSCSTDTESGKSKKEPLFSLRERLLISFSAVFSFVFVVLIFGPIDIFANNIEEMVFMFRDFMPWLLMISALMLVLVTLYFSAIRSKLFNVLTAIVFILPVGGCLQQMLFDTDTLVTGDATSLNIKMYILLVVFWLIVSGALICASIFGKKNWKQIAVFLAVLMFGMNGANLISDFTKCEITQNTKAKFDYVMTTDNMLSLSANENIVVLLVDRLDTEFVNYAFKSLPELKSQTESELQGFTYYSNATSLYGHTFPSVPYMITGKEYNGDVTADEYFDTAYKESTFLADLKDNGYSINLFIEDFYDYSDGSQLINIADNVAPVTGYSAVKSRVGSYMMCLSLARYVPQNFTTLTYILTSKLETEALEIHSGEHEMFFSDDAEIYGKLCSEGLKKDTSLDKNYTFLHLQGAHSPYTLTSDCKRSESNTNLLQQTSGTFKLILEYIKQMKEIGVYDSSTIIIAADHGDPIDDNEYELSYKITSALFIKPGNAGSQELQYSRSQVSHTNLLATIVQSSDIATNNNYGTSIFDITQDETTLRRYNRFVCLAPLRFLGIAQYEISGDANDFSNWKHLGTVETTRKWR